MKILFLSDIHLGHMLFERKAQLLKVLSGNYDEIVIVGDILDTWENRVLDIVKGNLEIIAEIRLLKNLTIVKGNHDPSIKDLKAVFPNARVVSEYKNDVFGTVVHGDEFDYIIVKYSFQARVLHRLFMLIQLFGLDLKNVFKNILHSIIRYRDKKYYNDLVLDIEKDAFNKYKKVIMGHTHLPKCVIKGQDHYINCGDFLHNGSYVEYENGIFSLRGEYYVA